MARKGTDVFRLIVMFKPVWSQKYNGEEYDPDGRDWREAKGFLELNPDVFDKREIFIQRAMKFLDDDFWYKPADGLRHQCHYFLRQYSRYSNAKRNETPGIERRRTGKETTKSLEEIEWYCPECQKHHKGNEMCPKLSVQSS